MTKTAIAQAGYNMTDEDWKSVGRMIDELCEMSKVVNAPADGET